MIKTDFFILLSLAFLLTSLQNEVFKNNKLERIYGIRFYFPRGWCITFSLVSLIASYFLFNNAMMEKALIFGAIAGGMQVIADLFLTKHVLSYEESKVKVFKTPLWMIALWMVTLTQLSYLWLRINTIELASLIFIITGSVSFYIFELAVNNYTKWWKREYCRQTFGVAHYAVVAEILTVALTPFVLTLIKSTVLAGIIGGLAIGVVFVVSCSVAFQNEMTK